MIAGVKTINIHWGGSQAKKSEQPYVPMMTPGTHHDNDGKTQALVS